MKNLVKKTKKLTGSEITYLFLWFLTAVLMLTLIFLFVGYNDAGIVFAEGKFEAEQNGIAATGILFVVSLIAAIFTTVIVSTRKKRALTNKQMKMGRGRNGNS